MLKALRLETEKLARSWMQYEPAKLLDYLVAGVEDPRINLQSILSRHFLLRSVLGERFREVMDHECRFAAVMNWLIALEPGELDAIRHALEKGADNAEGLQIPRFVLSTFIRLPLSVGTLEIPNYLRLYLGRVGNACNEQSNDSLNTFQNLWRELLENGNSPPGNSLTVLEPACGSANDYRFLEAFGIARFLDYTGLDLCCKNIENARALCPQVRFKEGNVFEIEAQDKAFDLSLVHDLFEHLSIEGLQVAVKEICRVTRRALCANFFQMDEIPNHVVRPTDEYHWNLLSMEQMKKLFATHGFTGQVIQIAGFLRQEFGCDYTHNRNAYTFILHRA
jgi:SAM-dependent methyltransferase